MRSVQSIAVSVVLLFPCLSSVALAAAYSADKTADNKTIVSLSVLAEQARQRVGAKPRVALPAESSEIFQGLESLEVSDGGHVPNYLRALAPMPAAVKAYAHLTKTILLGGTIEPEVKLAMGLRMAQMHDSPYVGAHMERLLRSTERGKALLATLKSGNVSTLSTADQLALTYAEELTQGVHGVSDSEFAKVSGYFNDAQLVEMTMTVCFFNYFDRLSNALNLPVEQWVLDSPARLQTPTFEAPIARIALISDGEMKATSERIAAMKDPKNPSSSWGIGFANSMRALLRCPELADAWMAYGNSVRQSSVVSRELQLQVSFAVSLANGCRYCTLHQVLGLRKLGVSPAKLLEMKKDDDALTPQELVAVLFARKLAGDPGSMNDADYEKLRATFGEQGALDVLMQTCMFSGFNRFTDGLRLPSEDAAVQTYKEVYGTEWK